MIFPIRANKGQMEEQAMSCPHVIAIPSPLSLSFPPHLHHSILALLLSLTWPLGPDGVADHEGHGIPKVIARLGEAPAVPLGAEGLGAIIAVDDSL